MYYVPPKILLHNPATENYFQKTSLQSILESIISFGGCVLIVSLLSWCI